MTRGSVAAWTVVSIAALGLVALATAGFGTREPQCAMVEAASPLDLRSEVDREHLRRDRAEARAIADAFSRAVARRPRLSDGIDARSGAETAPARSRVWCEEMLDRQVAALHHLSADEVRPHVPDASAAGAQAEADRASAAAPVSSVVSRPSR